MSGDWYFGVFIRDFRFILNKIIYKNMGNEENTLWAVT